MGCRIPEMEVLLAGGLKKPAGELKVGDKVETLHQHTFERQEAEVTYIRAVESPLLELTLSGKAFTCAELDQFYVPRDRQWVHALDLSEGDTIVQLEGEVEYEGQKSIGKGKSVELTVEGPHTYVCDGVLMHNKGGSPPPPTIIMPPPPPPPQIVQDVTPKQTYRDAAGYLKRMDDQMRAIEERRWDQGFSPAAIAAQNASTNLQAAELDYRLNRGGPTFASQTSPGTATASVINALAPKPGSGSTSREARITPSQMGRMGTPGGSPTGPAERLAAAQRAYALAQSRKDNEKFEWKEWKDPEWADRDWGPILDEWKAKSDKVEVGDDTPRQIPVG